MKRIQVVDLVRTISISLIMGMHLFGAKMQLPTKISFSLERFSPNFSNGCYGVSLFFVVSGYLITGLLLSGNLDNYRVDFKSFYIKRAARIFPLLILALLAGWLIMELFYSDLLIFKFTFKRPSFSYDLWFWLSIPAFLFNWLLSMRLNLQGVFPGLYWCVLWSLSIEEQFYLSYPWILKKLKNYNQAIFFLGAVIAGGFIYRLVLSLLGFQNYYYVVVTSFGSFDQIAIGSLLYFISEKWKSYLGNNKGQCAVICFLGLVMMVVSYINISPVFPTYLNYGLVFGPTFIAMGCFLFLLGGFHLDFFKSKIFGWLTIPGQLSYGCYIWHSLIIFIFWRVLEPMNPLPSFFLFMAIVVLFAYISYLFAEMPANLFIRRFFGVEKGRILAITGIK